jgi:Spy/CpxP family protein refolding chaperone
MNQNIKTILFIASVALNVVFAATYVTYKLPSLGGRNQPAPGVPLYNQLDLTPDQLARFKEERDKFHARLQELGQQIRIKQVELIDRLATTPPDRQAIDGKQQEIRRLQAEVQDRVVLHFLQESEFLTPEQRSRFFQLVKARIETSVQACPPWMRPLEYGQPGETKK